MSNYLIDKEKIIQAYCDKWSYQSEIIDNTYFVTNENFEKYNKNFNIVSLVVNPGLRNIFQEEKIKNEISTILLYGR